MVREIDDWADSPGNRHLCLLDGPAGFRKSAIARTVAQRWNVSKCLLGTFFFFRNSGDQGKGVRLVPTLSYQLTLSMPETRQPIENAFIKDPSLLNRPLEHQFQKLIIKPVLALPDLKLLRSPMRIIIDALDECEDQDFIPQLVETITCIDYSKFPVIFPFTSRREEYIRRTFESSPLNVELTRLSFESLCQTLKLKKKSVFRRWHWNNTTHQALDQTIIWKSQVAYKGLLVVCWIWSVQVRVIRALYIQQGIKCE